MTRRIHCRFQSVIYERSYIQSSDRDRVKVTRPNLLFGVGESDPPLTLDCGKSVTSAVLVGSVLVSVDWWLVSIVIRWPVRNAGAIPVFGSIFCG